MAQHFHLTRRAVLAGLGALAVTGPALAAKSAAPKLATASALGQLYAADFGVTAGATTDQSAAMQQALDAAHTQGKTLILPGGQISVQNLMLPGNTRVVGQPGQTVLIAATAVIATGTSVQNLVLEGIGFTGGPGDAGEATTNHGLLALVDSEGVLISNCQFFAAATSGLWLQTSGATVENCRFEQLDVAIFSNNSRGLVVRSNRISKCGNGGILIWRDAPGPDGSIITGNHIDYVLAAGGGSGENGNGINVFRADNVIVADNVIDSCDFSAVRCNTTRNAQIRGNTCTNIKEVALYSEFGFSGSVIASNIVDGAFGGISITNLDQGGQLAVCSGNIIRNINLPRSSANDPVLYGIYAEAETAITGNTVWSVTGTGILAGHGPYLRNVLIADNVISTVTTGIAVSVVQGAGAVRIAGNMISGAGDAVAGMAWDKTVTADLASDVAQFPNVTVEGNVVGTAG